jgi:hypothetical protein
MVIAGADVIPGAAASGGGGVAAKNYYAATNTSNITPTVTPTAIAMTAFSSEGSPGVAIDGTDSTKIDVTTTGIYVVQFQAVFAWTGQVLGQVNYVNMNLDFTGVADANSLAQSGFPWRQTCAYNEVMGGVGVYLALTTPPLGLAAGDHFRWDQSIGIAATAGTLPQFNTENSLLNIVRIG